MAEQWEEEQHLEDIVERRRMEGSSLKLDVMRKAPELVVNERMLQGQRVKNTEAKKEVPGWSTEEMRKWRSLHQSEMDLCWKKLAKRMEEEVLDKYKVEESRRLPLKATLWNGEKYAETRDIKLESGEKTAWREFSPCLENTICSACKASRRS